MRFSFKIKLTIILFISYILQLSNLLCGMPWQRVIFQLFLTSQFPDGGKDFLGVFQFLVMIHKQFVYCFKNVIFLRMSACVCLPYYFDYFIVWPSSSVNYIW